MNLQISTLLQEVRVEDRILDAKGIQGADDVPTEGWALRTWMREHIGTAQTILGPYLNDQVSMDKVAEILGGEPENVDLWIMASAPFLSIGGGVNVVAGYWPSGEALIASQLTYGTMAKFTVPFRAGQVLLVASDSSDYPVRVEVKRAGDAPPPAPGTPGSGTTGKDDTAGAHLTKDLGSGLQAFLGAIPWALVFGLIIFYFLFLADKRVGAEVTKKVAASGSGSGE